jgi:thioredoxin 1
MSRYFTSFAFTLLISIYTLMGFNNAAKPSDMEFLKTQMKKPTLIIFHADWCLPCKMVNKWITEDSEIKNIISNYDVQFYDYDLDKMMRTKYNVNKIPTLIILKNGEEVSRRVGIATGKSGLVLFLEAYKGA